MIDLKRTVIGREMGNKAVNLNATFQAGQIAQYDSNGNITVSDGTAPCGIFKWNKTSTLTGIAVKEAVVVNTDGVTASNLKHANVSNVQIEAIAVGAGTNYILNTDYTLNATNGTIVRLGAGAIPSGATVYVTYTYQLASSDITASNLIGLNFTLNTDDTQGSAKITIIQGLSTVYTDQFDTAQDYLVNQTVYATNTGLFTNQNYFGKAFGKVISTPTASDPFLGVEGVFTNDR